MNKWIILSLLSFLIPISHAMETTDEVSLEQKRIENLLNFQKRLFFIPTEEVKIKLQDAEQEILNSIFNKFLSDNSENAEFELIKDFVVFYAVLDLKEAANKLKEMPLSTNCHRIAFVDLDETLLFSGALSWLIICLNCIENAEKKAYVLSLLGKYGFSSIDQFVEWVNQIFSLVLPSDINFYYMSSVLNSEFSLILNNWHHEDHINIFALTSRICHYSDSAINALKRSKIDMKTMRSVEIENFFNMCGKSGIIYTNGLPKFGFLGKGCSFVDNYLEKITKENSPEFLDVIVVDNSIKVFKEVIDIANYYTIRSLEEKYKIKIRFKFFLPVEEKWLSPHHSDIWPNITQLGIDLDKAEDIALNVLQDFLANFCEVNEK